MMRHIAILHTLEHINSAESPRLHPKTRPLLGISAILSHVHHPQVCHVRPRCIRPGRVRAPAVSYEHTQGERSRACQEGHPHLRWPAALVRVHRIADRGKEDGRVVDGLRSRQPRCGQEGRRERSFLYQWGVG